MSHKEPTIIKLFCPHCGQKLSVPSDDLQQFYECPRCHRIEPATELVSADQTLTAVPIEGSDDSMVSPDDPTLVRANRGKR